MLASSSLILGPHFSSFVEMAEHLSALKVPSVKPTEGRAIPDDWSDVPAPWDPLRPGSRETTGYVPS